MVNEFDIDLCLVILIRQLADLSAVVEKNLIYEGSFDFAYATLKMTRR